MTAAATLRARNARQAATPTLLSQSSSPRAVGPRSSLSGTSVPRAWWSFSTGKWYGARRSSVAATPLFLLALAALALREALHPRSPLADLLELVLAVSFTLSLALMLTITLYNCPTALVPPHLRSEPGSRARKRARRAARRAA